MQLVTEARAVLRLWLANYWPRRGQARELGRQYRALKETAPLALADLLRFSCAFDSTIGADRDTTLINTGKREVALHLLAMLELAPEDLRHLKERTEDDE